MRNFAFGLILAVVTASPALAQQSDDWEIVRQPEEKTVFTYLPTTTNLVLGFRCVDGVYAAFIAGLPEARRNARTRTLQIKIGDSEMGDTVWNVTTDRTVALADYPAPLARELREGGAVTIVVPRGADDGRNIRYELTLPGSSAAIDETLTACGRPLADPRDALLPDIEEGGLPPGLVWAEQPRPRYPMTNYMEGVAVLSCMMKPDGGLEQCVVESEFPADGRFGEASLRGVDRARLNSPNETVGSYLQRIVAFRVVYRMR